VISISSSLIYTAWPAVIKFRKRRKALNV
jgi:hypothetical protein